MTGEASAGVVPGRHPDGREDRIRVRTRSERGAIDVGSVLVLVVVLVAAGVTAVLLAQTMDAAQDINAKARNIARTGQGINIATDSVIQLSRTNETAASILGTAEPLEGQLAEIVELADEVNELAASIDGTAGAINTTAGTINTTAGAINTSAVAINATAEGINAEAAEILDVATRIDDDVEQININLDGTIALAQAIVGDTGNIVAEARAAHQTAACIDQRLGGESGGDGHCQSER